jgi:predicted PhzF superfamily epimerase YddE/YHI9
MAARYYLLDTFTNEKFKGNPTPDIHRIPKI